MQDSFAIFDQTVALTWFNARTSSSTVIPHALRVRSQSASPSGTRIEKCTAVWRFPKSELPDEIPFPGDWVETGKTGRWTVTQVQDLDRCGEWKLTAVNLMQYFDLRETVDVFRPVWTLDEYAVPTPTYHLLVPGVPARILPPGTDSRVEIHFADPRVCLAVHDRLVTPDERIFTVQEFHPGKDWSEISRVVCVRFGSAKK